jgi:N-dimethylarginine dimethylaminohydrolase
MTWGTEALRVFCVVERKRCTPSVRCGASAGERARRQQRTTRPLPARQALRARLALFEQSTARCMASPPLTPIITPLTGCGEQLHGLELLAHTSENAQVMSSEPRLSGETNQLKPRPVLLAEPVRTHEFPEFLLCAPHYLSNQQPNNPLMEELRRHFPLIDRATALAQFRSIYRFVCEYSLVHVLPSVDGLQDQVYVSNLGITMCDEGDRTIVLANFKSQPRRGEELIGRRYFHELGIRTELAPVYFEGEADLKAVDSTRYVGAYGMRTCREALRWIGRRFDVEVLECELTNPYLYHLDCVLFLLSETEALVATDEVDARTLRQLEKLVDVVHVPTKAALAGTTNCVKLAGHLLCDDNRRLFANLPELYECEQAKLQFLNKLCERRQLVLTPFEMTEFAKSGAAMSCLFMRLSP